GMLMVLGAIHAYRRRRGYFWFVLLAFVFVGPFFAFIANMNLDAVTAPWVFGRFFLLSQVVLAPLMALGMTLAPEAIGVRIGGISVRANELVAGAVLLIAMGSAFTRYAMIDQSNTTWRAALQKTSS